jgi:hypothetical protein
VNLVARGLNMAVGRGSPKFQSLDLVREEAHDIIDLVQQLARMGGWVVDPVA